MNILVPYANTASSRAALAEAMEMAQPGDCVIVVATVAVPDYYAVDVMPGIVWVQTCRAERHLNAARAAVARLAPATVDVRYVRVQAREEAAAVVCAAKTYRADLILFAGRGGVVGRIARWLGTVGAVGRHAPCGVRVLTHAPAPRIAVSVPHPEHSTISHERRNAHARERE